MKALSLWQPWASLVAEGVKSIETRSWATSYRGPLAIHAAARKPVVPELFGMDTDAGGEVSFVFEAARRPRSGEWTMVLARDKATVHALPLGTVIATCTLVDVVPMVHAGEEGAVRTLDCDPSGALWLVEPRRYPELREVTDAIRNEWLNGWDPHHTADPAAWEEFCDANGLACDLEQHDVSDQRPFGDFAPGRFAWLLEDVVKLDIPVPARGRQQLWNWDEPTPAIVRYQA